jgi:hypothetical protein
MYATFSTDLNLLVHSTNHGTHYTASNSFMLVAQSHIQTASPAVVCDSTLQHQQTGACLQQLTSCGSLPLSNREIFFSFMSDQKMVPLCILEAVATTFSTMMGTLSSPCSLRSATKMEWRFEMMRKAALWSKQRPEMLHQLHHKFKEIRGNIYFILFLIYLFTTMSWNRIN